MTISDTMAPDPSGFSSIVFGMTRNSLASKWDALFDTDAKEWMAFKPTLGMSTYPCYSCRHIFFSKKSFLDHINRRVVLLKYICSECNNAELTFYNRCSCLLHCRKHFSHDKGQINLDNLKVSPLPFGLGGFAKRGDIPYLFDVEDDTVTGDTLINSQFYCPNLEDRGQKVLTLRPSYFVAQTLDQALALKQVASNIPKCQFISLAELKEMRQQLRLRQRNELCTEVKLEEPDTLETVERMVLTPKDQQSESPRSTSTINDPPASIPPVVLLNGTATAPTDNLMLPIITKVESMECCLSNSSKSPPTQPSPNENDIRCPECLLTFAENLESHFQGENKPLGEKYRCKQCKLMSPTGCSYKAHIRIHNKLAPFVCPDCGIEFPDIKDLTAHMDSVCFHMAKSVRYRCPGRRCGKIFASETTFGPHFKHSHIHTFYMCGTCKEICGALDECENHCLAHEGDSANIVKVFSCTTCGDGNMNWQMLKKHLDKHCKDISRCIYIYMCKFCKCYFRSILTMNNHLKNCKVQKTGVPRRVRANLMKNYAHSKYSTTQCKNCQNKLICLKSKPMTHCGKCMLLSSKHPVIVSDKCLCLLCNRHIDTNYRRQHKEECQYSQPRVFVEKLQLSKLPAFSIPSSSSSNSDFDTSQEDSPQKTDENRPRKKHKSNRPRKSDMEDDLTAEEPIPFNGTYQCRLCQFKNIDRNDFHRHIKEHRQISTAYQCMECGECFVVKPTLEKHLLHFHNIVNLEKYFLENDCYDQGAIIQLAKVIKAPYLANTVKENQCKVCLEQFDNPEAHNKHFRTHGMAFLMKNSM